MRIIISPAKRMHMDTDTFQYKRLPVFLKEADRLQRWVKSLSFKEAGKLWRCNDRLAECNYRRFQEMDLYGNLTPALISYEGIQYQYMAPEVFTEGEWSYVGKYLRILSGFYGVLAPFDGVRPYRLEMQAKVKIDGCADLYEYWGKKLYREVRDESRVILNLASKEYSKCIERYLEPEDFYITCIFGEWRDGKVIQKGTQVKMARGEMVRYMAEKEITDIKRIKGFTRLGYHFAQKLSSDNKYVFLKEAGVQKQTGGKR